MIEEVTDEEFMTLFLLEEEKYSSLYEKLAKL